MQKLFNYIVTALMKIMQKYGGVMMWHFSARLHLFFFFLTKNDNDQRPCILHRHRRTLKRTTLLVLYYLASLPFGSTRFQILDRVLNGITYLKKETLAYNNVNSSSFATSQTNIHSRLESEATILENALLLRCSGCDFRSHYRCIHGSDFEEHSVLYKEYCYFLHNNQNGRSALH